MQVATELSNITLIMLIMSATGILSFECFLSAVSAPSLKGMSLAIEPGEIQETEIRSFLKYSLRACVTPRIPNFVAL